MKKIIIGNLKMMMKTDDVSDYLKKLEGIKDVIICPTSIYIPYFLKNKYKVGLQNICGEDLGPFTGEVCPNQAVSMGIRYTLVGHNERRINFNETNEEVNKKILQANKYGMTSILCVGESLKEKNKNQTKKVLKKQLTECLKNTLLDKVIIAYEPNWAIGTNEMPTNKEIEMYVEYIKEFIKKNYNHDIKVIYGGSISKENILKIKNIENLDGILIGGSSTRALEFKEIVDKYLK